MFGFLSCHPPDVSDRDGSPDGNQEADFGRLGCCDSKEAVTEMTTHLLRWAHWGLEGGSEERAELDPHLPTIAGSTCLVADGI